MMQRRLFSVAIVFVAVGFRCQVAASDDSFVRLNVETTVTAELPDASNEPAANYTVREYDPRRNPFDDLNETLRKAQESKRRVLIQVGGNWCGWCHILERTFRQNDRVKAGVQDRFLIMKVNVSQENTNRLFLSQFPPFVSFPHLFVLDGNGTLLHSQDPTRFEQARGYSEQALLEFIETWAAKSPPES